MFHVKHDGSPLAGSVSRETRARLEIYAALLLKWNRTINLVGRQTEAALWERHFADSLQLQRYLPSWTTSIIDLGSGAGFPGMVLAIAADIPVDLIECDARKAAFLREVVAKTGASARVHPVKIEDAQLPPGDVVTARALAPMPQLLAMAARFLKPEGVALFLKGERVDEELTQAVAEWHMKVERHQSVTDPRGVIVRLSEVHPV